MRKLFIVLIILMIVFGMTQGVITRLSYRVINLENYNKIENFIICNSGDMDEKTLNEIISINDIEKNSELVAKVVFSGHRQPQLSCLLSEVKITKIYKGNSKLNNQSIYVYEPSYFCFSSNKTKNTYNIVNYYNIMLPSKEYILFLNLKKYPKGYIYNEKDLITYNVSKYSCFGKYSVNVDTSAKAISFDSDIKYKDVINLPAVSENKQIIDKYIELEKDVQTSYK